ncbi:hypothetical protein VNO78_11599 [Psophocarpus tetragonolobus]|uniref:Uncharacterized protein n=1 Tax=Psophocarpus tetragonolobus TaxID=3891 RepID=A0AAN9SUH8_PSOTE
MISRFQSMTSGLVVATKESDDRSIIFSSEGFLVQKLSVIEDDSPSPPWTSLCHSQLGAFDDLKKISRPNRFVFYLKGTVFPLVVISSMDPIPGGIQIKVGMLGTTFGELKLLTGHQPNPRENNIVSNEDSNKNVNLVNEEDREDLEVPEKALINIVDKVIGGTNRQRKQPCVDPNMVAEGDYHMTPKKRGYLVQIYIALDEASSLNLLSKLQSNPDGPSECRGPSILSPRLESVINTPPFICTPPYHHNPVGNSSQCQCPSLLGEGRFSNNHEPRCFGRIILLVGEQ